MALLPLSKANNKENAEFYVDLGFAIVFLITIVILLVSSCRTFKRTVARDYFSVMTTVLVMITLICKFVWVYTC